MRVDERRPSEFRHLTDAGIAGMPPPENWKELEDQALATAERFFTCAACLDQGFTSHVRWVVKLRGWYSAAWFCGCAKGRAAEAGYWFGTCYPFEGNQRVVSERGERELEAYLRAHPLERAWLPDAITHLRERYEDARKRKLRQVQEGKDAFLAKVDLNG